MFTYILFSLLVSTDAQECPDYADYVVPTEPDVDIFKRLRTGQF